jgi:hypothetical protein
MSREPTGQIERGGSGATHGRAKLIDPPDLRPEGPEVLQREMGLLLASLGVTEDVDQREKVKPGQPITKSSVPV